LHVSLQFVELLLRGIVKVRSQCRLHLRRYQGLQLRDGLRMVGDYLLRKLLLVAKVVLKIA
jgi:hypothetical protein